MNITTHRVQVAIFQLISDSGYCGGCTLQTPEPLRRLIKDAKPGEKVRWMVKARHYIPVMFFPSSNPSPGSLTHPYIEELSILARFWKTEDGVYGEKVPEEEI